MKFFHLGGKAVRVDHISAVERIGPDRSRVLVGDTWIEMPIGINDLAAILENRLADE